MFLVETVKRVMRELPKDVGREPERGRYQWCMNWDETDRMSINYSPSLDPLNPACPINPGYDED